MYNMESKQQCKTNIKFTNKYLLLRHKFSKSKRVSMNSDYSLGVLIIQIYLKIYNNNI